MLESSLHACYKKPGRVKLEMVSNNIGPQIGARD